MIAVTLIGKITLFFLILQTYKCYICGPSSQIILLFSFIHFSLALSMTSRTKPMTKPPIDASSPCSKCTFYFMSSLITLGHKRPLETDDVPDLPIHDNSNTVDTQYQTAMNKALSTTPHIALPSHPFSAWTSVGIALKARGIQFFYGGICLVIWSLCYGLQP